MLKAHPINEFVVIAWFMGGRSDCDPCRAVRALISDSQWKGTDTSAQTDSAMCQAHQTASEGTAVFDAIR